MSLKRLEVFTITGTSAASASTTVVGNPAQSLIDFDWFTVVATLIGGTGGTVDCCLQFQTGPGVDEWWDWVRFPQVAAATTKQYLVEPQPAASVLVVQSSTGAAPAITLAANTTAGGHPGHAVRLVVTAGSGTSAGAVQTVKIRGWRRR